MIYLSAQPDDYYFLWQLQLQIFNFKSLGIQPENIHVLIGYNPNKGLNVEFSRWIKGNTDALFFTYPDSRLSPTYLPSIQPHIIAKHVNALPYLEEEIIFYHDSDIIFRCLPDFETLNETGDWYASDTRDYLAIKHILDTGGESVLNQMCSVVGITVTHVANQDPL
jgi:hypothetical protein